MIESDYNSRISCPKSVSLICTMETARYLPLCVHGRLKHGYHFTLKSVLKDTAVTFVVSKVAGTLVSPDKPFAAQGTWLQVTDREYLGTFLSKF